MVVDQRDVHVQPRFVVIVVFSTCVCGCVRECASVHPMKQGTACSLGIDAGESQLGDAIEALRAVNYATKVEPRIPAVVCSLGAGVE